MGTHREGRRWSGMETAGEELGAVGVRGAGRDFVGEGGQRCHCQSDGRWLCGGMP